MKHKRLIFLITFIWIMIIIASVFLLTSPEESERAISAGEDKIYAPPQVPQNSSPREGQPQFSPGLGNLCSFSAEYNCHDFCNENDKNRKKCQEYCKENPDNEFCTSFLSVMEDQATSPPENENVDYLLQGQKPPKYEHKIEFNDDLIISSGSREFNDVHLILKGNVIVNGTGKLVVSNAYIEFKQEHHFQYSLLGRDDAQIELENVFLSTNGKWIVDDYRGNSKVAFKNVSGYSWHGTGENAVVEVNNSYLGITIWSNNTLKAENSNLFIELGFEEANGTFKLPLGHVDEFDINLSNRQGKRLIVDVKNSTFREWGTTIINKANITFIDSKLTIGINAASDWTIWPGPLDPYVKVSGLRAVLYDNFTLDYDTNTLRLINTEITSWYPQASREATVEISNSDLADVSSNHGNARLIIRNSTAAIAVARQNLTYEFYNSIIRGDVVAQDDGEIYLYNTKVGGTITQKGNGKVFVDDWLFGS